MNERECEKVTKRNQIIDIAKLVFCIGVLFNHTSALANGIDDGLPIFVQYGFLGVEFFFIVSGFLMAKKAFADVSDDIGKSTIHFIARKFSIIYPYFFVAWIIAFIVDIYTHSYSLQMICVHLLQSIPFHMQLSMSGIPVYNILGPTWYISAMLTCMFFIYPLVKKFKNIYVYVIAPILVVLSYGYLGQMVGCLATIEPINNGFIHTGLFRGIAGISLGCVCYGICENLKNQKWTKLGGVLLTGIELLAYIAAILCMQTQQYFRPDFIVVFFICIAITISFSGTSNTVKLFKRDFPLIGQLSLVLYLADAPARALTRVAFSSMDRMEQIIPAFILNFVFGMIVLIGGNFLKKIFASTKEKLQKTMISE